LTLWGDAKAAPADDVLKVGWLTGWGRHVGRV
jgi:hypothetical protein